MRIVSVCFLLISFNGAFSQSPWVTEKGKGYFQLGYTSIGPYSDLFTKTGANYSLTREVTDQTVQLYGEFGLGSNTSIITSVPFKFLEAGALTAANPPLVPNEKR